MRTSPPVVINYIVAFSGYEFGHVIYDLDVDQSKQNKITNL